MWRHVQAAALALLLSTGGLLARPLSEAENRQLQATVEQFDAAMRSGNHETIVATIPPRVMEHIAKKAGVGVDALRQIIVAQTKAALADVKLLSFGMDLGKAEHRELANGEPYVLIPTETAMDAGAAGKFRAKSATLALLDEGKWYLLRVSELQQVAIMKDVYPEFASIEFPAGTVEAME